MFRVYLITNTISGKTYIGQTKQEGLQRWRGHKTAASRGEKHPLYSAIRKYGKDHFSYQEVCEFATKEEADKAERMWIILSGSHTSVNGYVCTWGGDGRLGPDSELRWKRINAGRTINPGGSKSPFFKSEFSTEAIVALYAQGNSMYKVAHILGCDRQLVRGRLRSAGIQSRKASDYENTNKGRVASPETRLKMSLRRGLKNPTYRAELDECVPIMADLYLQGLSTHNIAKQFDCSFGTVKKRLRSFGVAIRKPGRQKPK